MNLYAIESVCEPDWATFNDISAVDRRCVALPDARIVRSDQGVALGDEEPDDDDHPLDDEDADEFDEEEEDEDADEFDDEEELDDDAPDDEE